MTDTSTISNPLRAARDYHGYSRERVAAQLGISAKTLERWERGDRKHPLPRHLLTKLARIYDVDPDSLRAA